MSQDRKILVLEVGRPIQDDVRAQLGQPDVVISVPRPILEEEIPQIAGQVYHKIRDLAQGGREVWLVLSGPLGLAFLIGQLVGLSHYKIVVWQFGAGRYRQVPPITREVMFT